MSRQTQRLPNLLKSIPEGVLVTTEWLRQKGVSRQLAAKYVESGWLDSPARGVYGKPGISLPWEDVVASLHWLGFPVWVGGVSALEFHGALHYLRFKKHPVVHLYVSRALPAWFAKLSPDTKFAVKRDRLFKASRNKKLGIVNFIRRSTPLPVSSSERAALELLEAVPAEVSFGSADKAMEGLVNLRPQLLMELLSSCTSIRVKRLFLWFAERHGHAWFKRLDTKRIALGIGKRQIVPGGRLDPKYLITVPREMTGAPGV